MVYLCEYMCVCERKGEREREIERERGGGGRQGERDYMLLSRARREGRDELKLLPQHSRRQWERESQWHQRESSKMYAAKFIPLP